MSLPLFNNPTLKQVKNALSSIGYKGKFLVEGYEYADMLSKNYSVNQVALAGFGDTPPSYRNCCVGVAESNGMADRNVVIKHRSLCSPLFFLINQNTLQQWILPKEGEPELLESVSHDSIPRFFEDNAEAWEPERIFRAKVIKEVEKDSQLDFYDAGLLTLMEGQIHKKLEKLLSSAIAEVEESYKINISQDIDYQEIYRLVFRFIVAKVVIDRKDSIGITTSDAVGVLKAVEDYYNPPVKVLEGVPNRRRVLEVAWKEISSAFHFQNISVDDLAFVYESSLITEETRKIFGTHSTPPRIAEYIVQKLPFEEISADDRYVFEPCSGHGGFLVSALRRLRELLPAEISDKKRHKYLTQRISAMEIDPFSLEACWSRLVLADYPHPNGWNLHLGDIFKDEIFTTELKKSRILLCNPPFEDFKQEERKFYSKEDGELLPRKPAEFLKRVFEFPPDLMGLVLPRLFESGGIYRQFHRQLAETYDTVELVGLPEVFNYSDATTMLVIASGKKEHHSSVTVASRLVEESARKDFFEGDVPPATKIVYDANEYLKSDFTLWSPPLSRIWKLLDTNTKIKSIAEIHQGIKWHGRKDKSTRDRQEVSDSSKKGYKKGIPDVQSHFKQFCVYEPRYLSVKPEDQATNAYNYKWDEPKVVYNAARNSRKVWRLGAFADYDKLVFTKNFFAIWLKEKYQQEISEYALAAVLNSPLANAFIYYNTDGKHNHARVVEKIPLPDLENLRFDGKIHKLSKHLHDLLKVYKPGVLKEMVMMSGPEAISKWYGGKELLLQIDAEILKAYSLPPKLERELLDLFQDVKRPTPFEFKGYYPEDFTAYFPLHELISDKFDLAGADKLIERLPKIENKELGEYLDYLFEDTEDE